ncbi:hypothetical protein NP233_g11909 [Leucocoprinus birnbaumii]|uniref:RNA-directed DNA polymerase n=1 Tax=Leucocoprinus birnbaumii TaxID=56174 RepID=A0AAD5VGK1_9AGAR|nr:hypothetical protein NP233_g11909 [Leucocoprinus birnbaumii]
MDVSPSPLTPSPPGSWERVSRSPRSPPRSLSRLETDVRSPPPSLSRSVNRFEVLSSLPDYQSMDNSSTPRIEITADNTDPILFAISPLDEPNEELSPEQLDAVNQAAANLSDDQREEYSRRHPGVSASAQASTSKDKDKGTDPRNWGAAGIPDRELDVDTQRVLLEHARVGQDKHIKKHKKRSKDKEREHRKKSKATKKARIRKEKEAAVETREASVFSNASGGVANHIRRIANASKGKATSRAEDLRRIDDNLRPSKQINPHSYLGKALADARANSRQPSDIPNHSSKSRKHSKRNRKSSKKSKSKGKRKHRRRKGSPSSSEPSSDSSTSGSEDDYDPENSSSSSSDDSYSSSSDSDPSSNSSSSNSDGSESESDSSSSSDSDSGRHGRRRYRPTKSLLKPIPPEKYDGSANPQAFFQFVRQSLDYVTDGRAPRKRQVSIISHFLTEKAYEFFTREVSLDPSRWNLDEFFEALFDYCFPPDFRAQQRRKLGRFFQNELSVRDYASQLNEFFSILGYDDDRNEIDMVSKLWYGLNRDIQKQLWLERLNPERSSYNEVLRMAETIEMSNLAANGNRTVRGEDDKPRKHQRRHNDRNGRRRRSSSRPRGSNNPGNSSRRVRFESFGTRRDQPRNHQPSGSNRNEQRDRRYSERTGNDTRNSDRRTSRQNRHNHSEQEIERLRAENRCFRCKEVGHTSRHCPTQNNVASSNRGPPGQKSLNNIEISAIQQAEDLRQLAETTECADLIELSMLDFGDYDGDAGYFTHLFDDITLPEPEEANLDTISSNDTQSYHEKVVNPSGTLLDVRDPRALENLGIDPPMSSLERVTTWFSKIEDEPYPSEGDYYPLEKVETKVFHYPKKDIRALRYMDHLVDKRREEIGSVKHFWLDRIAQKLLPTSWGLRVLYVPSGDVIYISNDILIGVLSVKTSYIFRWRPQSLAKYVARMVYRNFHQEPPKALLDKIDTLGADLEYFDDPVLANAENVLNMAYSHEVFEYPDDFVHIVQPPRFSVRAQKKGSGVIIHDHLLKKRHQISRWNLMNKKLNIVNWVEKQHSRLTNTSRSKPENVLKSLRTLFDTSNVPYHSTEVRDPVISMGVGLEAYGQQIEAGTYPSIQRNSTIPRDISRVIPRPIVVVVKIKGHPCRALIDTGSMGDFISSTIAQQLNVPKVELSKAITVQMACQGSRSNINYRTRVRFAYQKLDYEREFDVMNLANYDVVLGTPFLYQHRVSLCLEPPAMVIGSETPVPLKGPRIAKLSSRAMSVYEEKLDEIKNRLLDYAKKVCRDGLDTPLPPLREINHEIPLIDLNAKYSWRPSRCPDALMNQWLEKKEAYVRSGRWVPKPVANASPMLLIPKPRKPGEPIKLRTVCDVRQRNSNTRKLSSPLPDIDGILRRVASAKYRSTIDLADAYEQIRVIPEHIDRTAMATPSGTMISLVMQQGDCNASATFQMVMTRIFAPYIGDFLDVYLDDIILYSNSLEEHTRHVKLVIDILEKEKFYVSEHKLHFLEKELRILGRTVSDEGIRMDSDKVDALCRWKVPTNRDLLRGFLGSAGYLADDIDSVRIPMGVLSELTGDTVPFRWEYTHQRAFEDIKNAASRCKDHNRKPLQYGPDALPINLVTDGCVTGIAGVQNSTQRNKTIPVHEIEMLAGVEAMMRHKDILQGTKFKWYTDHKGLVSLFQQKDLSGRQARWLEKLSQFDFEVVYVPGSENILSDALSRIYSGDQPGTVRARSEYTYHDVIDNDHMPGHSVTMPVHVGSEGVATIMAVTRGQTKRRTEGANERQNSRESVPPKERMEGGSRADKPKTTQTTPGINKTSPPEQKDRLTIRIPARPRSDVADKEQSAEKSTSSQTPATTRSSGDASAANSGQSTSSYPHTTLRVPPLVNLLHDAPNGIDIPSAIRDQYRTDPQFKSIIDSLKEYKNFRLDNGLLLINIQGSERLCIPNVSIDNRSIREVLISEAHSLLSHLGAARTCDYLREQVWWKSIVKDIHNFCESCMTCKRSKPTNHKPYGLLQPLPVPSRPWENIGVDFVGPLPESRDRDAAYDSVTVIIDRLTGMIHLVPSRVNYNARQVAELIFREVYRLHGLPKSIVSDRDTLFTSTFWQRLNELVGTKLLMSSAYHPESDGSTERANRTIVQMLRQCVAPDQKNWVSKLPAIEFAINSARSEVTGYAPFFLNHGQMPRSLIWNSPTQSEYPGVRVFAQNMKNAVVQAHDSILAHRIKEIRTANRKRIPSPFSTSDLVYISTKNISFPRGLARKLVLKFIGPYPIIRDFGNNSYKIGLSKTLRQRGVHDVFHSSLLRIHVPNDDRLFPGRLDTQVWDFGEFEQEWAVERIRSHSGSKRQALFEVEWKSGDVTWLPYDKIDHLTALEHYLEILGVKHVDQLTGKETYIEDEQVPTFDTLPQLPTSTCFIFDTSPSSSLMSESINWKRPPGLTAALAIFPWLHARGPAIWTAMHPIHKTIHVIAPAALRLMLKFDGDVRFNRIRHEPPIGHHEFVAIFNLYDSPYKMCYIDPATGQWVIPPNSKYINLDILDLRPFHYATPPTDSSFLRNLGMLDSQGAVSEERISKMTHVLLDKMLDESSESPPPPIYSAPPCALHKTPSARHPWQLTHF